MPRGSDASRAARAAQPSGEYSRKDKSLGLLCENFVHTYGNSANAEICLDAAATALGVERRRIYDIVNVLESVGIVTRKAKNCYVWNGFSQIPDKLNDLEQKALSDLYGTAEDFRTPPASRKVYKRPPKPDLVLVDRESPPVRSSQSVGSSLETEQDLENARPAPPRTGSRKEKSLGVLSQRFVQLFLLAGSSAVSLDQAAVQLLGRSPSDSDPLAISPAEGDASKLLKTKVRRLYDIANILSSLNLIEKVHTTTRKPAFKWLGPAEELLADELKAATAEASKRSAPEELQRPRTAIKRRKSFAGAEGRNGGKLQSPAAHDSPVTELADAPEDREGFDPKALNHMNSVVLTFPGTYFTRWRNYVNYIQDMLLDGRVTREHAYVCVAPLFSPSFNGDMGDVAETQYEAQADSQPETQLETQTESQPETQPEAIAATPQAKGKSASLDTPESADTSPTQLMAAQQLSALAATVRTGSEEGAEEKGATASDDMSGRVEKSDIDNTALLAAVKVEAGKAQNAGDSRQGSTNNFPVQMGNVGSLPFAMPCGTQDAKGSIIGMPYGPDFVADYMQKAKEAGPQYVTAAEQWLEQVNQWRKIWASPFAALSTAPISGAQPHSTEKTPTVAKDS